MARASAAMLQSFNGLLREHLRGRRSVDRPRALELLHAHFGDRVGAAFGRTAQLRELLEGPRAVEMSAEARALLQRACAVGVHHLPEGSVYGPALRRADLGLGTFGGMRSVLGLPANGGRPVGLLLGGLAPEAAADWVATQRRVDVRVFLGPEELELCQLFPLLGERPGPSAAPLLTIVPQGELRPEGCRWLSAAAGESFTALVEQGLGACAALLGLPEAQRGALEVRAVATGGLALARALEEEPARPLDLVELEDALYGALPGRLREHARHNARLRLRMDVLPHQSEVARELAQALGAGRVELEFRRPVERARQLLHRNQA